MRNRIVDTAEELAREFHKDQKYGDKSYFWAHISDVVNRVKNHICNQVDSELWQEHIVCICAAYLHDVLEDCDVTEENLFTLIKQRSVYSFSGVEREMDVDVDCRHLMLVVKALTKRENEGYTTYIQRVKQNKYAAIVKYFDSEANMYACVLS